MKLEEYGVGRQVVHEYLDKEVAEQRVWVVGATGEVAGIQCSLFGVIPKKGKPGRWRLLLNLSAPDGASVNDGIPKDLYVPWDTCLWMTWLKRC